VGRPRWLEYGGFPTRRVGARCRSVRRDALGKGGPVGADFCQVEIRARKAPPPLKAPLGRLTRTVNILLYALQLYVTCYIAGRVAIDKFHEIHRQISRSSSGVQPSQEELKFLINLSHSGPEHALHSQCRPIFVRPTVVGATVSGPAVADPTVVEPTIVSPTVVVQPLSCQIALHQRRGGDATTGSESDASNGGYSDNSDSGGRGSLDGGGSESAGGGDRTDSDGEGFDESDGGGRDESHT